jgi:hypothetical protein
MNLSRILPATLALAAAASTAALVAGPADAEAKPRARVSAHASDTTPASGQEFVITGRLVGPHGHGRVGVVKVQTLRDGAFVNLSGARVSTDSDGDYRVRVILSQTGDRTLRIVGNPAGDGLRNAHHRLAVVVH